MATNTCNLLKDAIMEEKEASEFYNMLGKEVNKIDKWKINEIKKEEVTHKEELQQILKRYCDI